jgi:hypothetical protein
VILGSPPETLPQRQPCSRSAKSDPASGVIDMHARATLERTAIFPTRVIALTPDITAYSFTMFQQPGMPDSLSEAQHASLEREFEHIRSTSHAPDPAASTKPHAGRLKRPGFVEAKQGRLRVDCRHAAFERALSR